MIQKRKLKNYLKNIVFLFLLCSVVVCLTACDMMDEDRIAFPFSQVWNAPMKYDDSNATKSLSVAAVSLEIDISPEVTRNKMITFIDKIKLEKPEVRLILFSEKTLGYYYKALNPAEYQKSIAETIPGETTNIISQKAKECQIYISFGMTEKVGEDLYNSQVLIDTAGVIVSVYRKYYLTPEDIKSGFKAGQDITVNVIDNIKVATMICNDMNSLTVNKKIQEAGVELVLFPVANTTSSFGKLMELFRQYTFSWVLSANRVGFEDNTDYDGLLYLAAPSGERRVIQRGKEGYILGEVKVW